MEDKEPEDINEILGKYVKDATQFIARTSTIEQMLQKGMKLDPHIPETDEQYIDRLFGDRKGKALELLKKIPVKPNIALPPITSLYDEITECILFGNNGAAITLSAVLVEFSLKHAIVDRKAGTEKYDGKEWDRVEKKELGPIIKEAEDLRMFTEDGIRQLINFKNTIRNPWLHYNIKKITEDVILQKGYAYNLEKNEVIEIENLKAVENPFLWEMGKRNVDEQTVFDAFGFADSVVKALFLKNKPTT